jgi:hypothetical protein
MVVVVVVMMMVVVVAMKVISINRGDVESKMLCIN